MALAMLGCAQSLAPGRALLRALAGTIPARPIEFAGLRFPNVLGVAAGLDKDVRATRALALLGFGHAEVGTLTPRPQPGNPRPRVFRLVPDGALINRMGFPNGGVEAALPRLRRLQATRPAGFVVGVSLGKQKETPLADAAADYLAVMRAVYTWADYLAVNISSPNTPGLRELQGGDYLGHLCRTLVAESRHLASRTPGARRPLLVKIAPDMAEPELDEVLQTLLAAGIDGVIATNTTLARPATLRSPAAGETGGLSGRPLAAPSTAIIRHIRAVAGPRLPIIGVGGVFTADDVREKLDAGATLVQVYTGFVYEGPTMAGRVLRTLG